MAFQIVEETSGVNKKYRIARRSICFKLSEIPESVEDPEVWVKDGIHDIVTHIIQDVDPDDKIGFTFGSECVSKGDAYLPFRKAKNVTFEDIWNLLGRIYQSNSEGFHSDTFRMTMTHIKPYRGAGGHRVKNYNTFEEECAKRRGIVMVNNNDNLCLPRALVVARAYAIKSPFINQIRRNRAKMQDNETERLLQEAGVQISQNGAGADELKKFQAHMKEFKITVYAYGSKGRTVLFEGPNAPLKINLLHQNNHYNVIISLKAAFCCSYYCESCHTPYDHKEAHRCATSCPCCQQSPPCERTKQEVTCDDCQRKFRGLECYTKHKTPSSRKYYCMCTYKTMS